ncbi:MAG: hypothetical protein ABI193_02695, partial [Minicystis sp.]
MSEDQTVEMKQGPSSGPSWPRVALVGSLHGIIVLTGFLTQVSGAVYTAIFSWVLLAGLVAFLSAPAIIGSTRWARAPFLPGVCALAVVTASPFLSWMSIEWFRKLVQALGRSDLPLQQAQSTRSILLGVLGFA